MSPSANRMQEQWQLMAAEGVLGASPAEEPGCPEMGAPATSAPVNPFQVNQPQPLTLNQLRGSPVLGTSTSFGPGPGVESMAVASMTSTAPHPALGASGSSLTPLGPAAMNMAKDGNDVEMAVVPRACGVFCAHGSLGSSP
ncbi:Epsin-2 [Plecturocebus cupreus]